MDPALAAENEAEAHALEQEQEAEKQALEAEQVAEWKHLEAEQAAEKEELIAEQQQEMKVAAARKTLEHAKAVEDSASGVYHEAKQRREEAEKALADAMHGHDQIRAANKAAREAREAA